MHYKKNINRSRGTLKKNKNEEVDNVREEGETGGGVIRKKRVRMVPYVKEYNNRNIFNSKLDKVYRYGALEYPIDVDKKREEWHNTYCEDLVTCSK